MPDDDARRPLIDLYLPICSATSARPITVGHLGQSLDGFIATHAGESQYVTGPENILHMHRMRALCDAVVVGAGTVAADDPQLTTRHVSGPSPLRVVLDPTRRLEEHYRVFSDDAAATLYVLRRSASTPGERHFGRATLVAVDDRADSVDLPELVRLLHARGCSRIFVEGGGVTVSMFLEANLLDRLQMAIAPLIIGDGRPAIRLPPPAVADRLPSPGLPRVPDGRRRPVRLRPARVVRRRACGSAGRRIASSKGSLIDARPRLAVVAWRARAATISCMRADDQRANGRWPHGRAACAARPRRWPPCRARSPRQLPPSHRSVAPAVRRAPSAAQHPSLGAVRTS